MVPRAHRDEVFGGYAAGLSAVTILAPQKRRLVSVPILQKLVFRKCKAESEEKKHYTLYKMMLTRKVNITRSIATFSKV